ncbi:MAG: Mrp family chromosome partitioning ATPase [Oceanicoccus sp.]|jgi:Mrp family chromosome partitioning ATPase
MSDDSKKGVRADVGVITNMAEVVLKTQDELEALKIIYPGMYQREVLNSFRELRSRLLDKVKGDNFVLLVTSLGMSGGGSSFVSMNMSASFALDEERTAIYIDCNYDSPYTKKLLGGDYDYGLMDYLKGNDVELKDIIYSTGVPRVRVIPAGKIDDSSLERLASDKMHQLIASIKERYPDRFVVLGVPSVSESSLPRILSKVADISLLVVPCGKVTPNQVMAGIDAVGEEKFAGLVFNN